MSTRVWISLLVLGLCVSSAQAAADSRSDTIERSFTARAGGKLVIDSDRGSIRVEGSGGNQVKVLIERKVVRGTDVKAAEVLSKHDVRITEGPSGEIRVEAHYPATKSWSWRTPQLQVEFKVTVPRDFDVEAETGGGSIHVADVHGTVAVRTSGGSLHLESLTGRIQGRTSGGSIKAGKVNGTIDLRTAGGSIAIAGASGEDLKANTAGGSITLEDISVPAEVRTSGGAIQIVSSATPLKATTSGGSIRAKLTSVPRDEVSLRTSAGSITFTAPAESAFELDAATSAGSVRSDFAVPVNDPKGKSRLQGAVNGGGEAKVTLRTSGGSIRVEKGL